MTARLRCRATSWALAVPIRARGGARARELALGARPRRRGPRHELSGPITAALDLELAAAPARCRDAGTGPRYWPRSALAVDDLAETSRASSAGKEGTTPTCGRCWTTRSRRGGSFAEVRGADQVSVVCGGPGRRRCVAAATGSGLAAGDRQPARRTRSSTVAVAVDVRRGGSAPRSTMAAVRIEVRDDGPRASPALGGSTSARRGLQPAARTVNGCMVVAVAAVAAIAHGGRLRRSAPSERGARLVLELPLVVSGRPAGVWRPAS